MTANDSKSYLSYSNELIVKYNKSYHRSIGKKPIDLDNSALTLWSKNRVIKLLNLKLAIESGLLSTRMSLANVTPKIGQARYL